MYVILLLCGSFKTHTAVFWWSPPLFLSWVTSTTTYGLGASSSHSPGSSEDADSLRPSPLAMLNPIELELHQMSHGGALVVSGEHRPQMAALI